VSIRAPCLSLGTNCAVRSVVELTAASRDLQQRRQRHVRRLRVVHPSSERLGQADTSHQANALARWRAPLSRFNTRKRQPPNARPRPPDGRLSSVTPLLEVAPRPSRLFEVFDPMRFYVPTICTDNIPYCPD
jgi:hypothetical protein